ncbi:MAG: FMN-binding protein [Planctomycetes bacterium]|nr:FMN-binding protein [Planctomycetota bacterium]
MAKRASVWLGFLLSMVLARARGDELELLNGQRVRGEVVEQTAAMVIVRLAVGDGSAQMKFPTSRIHAITVGGERRVLNDKPVAVAPRPVPKSEPAPEAKSEGEAPTPKPITGRVTRSRADVEALIKQAGSTPPDWYEKTPLDYPQTLDLSWPERVQGPWNPSRNVGQYIWSTINENPSRWHSGIRFLHHLLTVHKDNPAVLARVMDSLGSSYFNLLQDWARAAFWWQKCEQRRATSVFNTVRLAECYWRLGSKPMAAEKLREVDRYISSGIVKLWADMGEVDKALKLAYGMTQEDVRTDAGWVAEGHLLMGDTYRLHGRFREALAAYQKVLAVPAVGQRKGHVERSHKRAQANIDAVKLYDALDLKRVPDGTYRATMPAYAGPLEVAVTIAAGRIEEVKVTRTEDKQYYASLTAVPKQIVDKQSLKGIDAVTQATITSEAIVNAAAKALAGAMK